MSKPKLNIDSIVDDTRWLELDFDIKQRTKEIALITLEYIKFYKYSSSATISIKFTNDEDIKILNRDFRKKNHETNVLSFPHQDLKYSISELNKLPKSVYLGDIAISYDSILKEISEQSKTFLDHFSHLLIHSILHLLGFDHIEHSEAQIMENLEIEILKKMKIKNPYIINDL